MWDIDEELADELFDDRHHYSCHYSTNLDCWLVSSDFVTNCDEDQVRFYEEASFQTHIPVIISDYATDCRGIPIPGYRAIYIPRECRPKDEEFYTDLSDFWTVFEEIRTKALMPIR